MFDVDAFVHDCIAAVKETDPRLAVRDLLERALRKPSDVAEALPPERAGIERLHVSPELTVLKIVWGPHQRLRPHDHRMWAAIGIYGGEEANSFYRRTDQGLVQSGGKHLRDRDIVLLGDDVIHAVHNPRARLTGAIHVYGGDFFTTPRSEWDPDTLEESPFDVERTLREFEEQNAMLESPSEP